MERASRRDAGIGDLVAVRVEGGRARIVDVLGKPDCARDVLRALMLDRGLDRGFDRALEREAREATVAPQAAARRDLCGLRTITIDPASARDFDDAISVERHGDGLRVDVHIADVSAYVAEESRVDLEARDRGCSVYIPADVEPMLPGSLADDACSLVPGENRNAVTVKLELDDRAKVVKASFDRSVIRSDRRFTYEEVDRIFAGDRAAAGDCVELLDLARDLAEARRKQRFARGSLAVETSEPEFDFDGEGNVVAGRSTAQSESHGLIEEMMIMANEQVASHLEGRGHHLLYRIHEQPEPQAVDFLVDQLASLDVPTPPTPEAMTPAQAADLAGAISVKVREHIKRLGHGERALTALVLRALKQAVYSPHNRGHSGLASRSYCHFTSPIRRYPDLVVHRALAESIGGNGALYNLADLEAIGWHSSAMEREAAQLEHDADDICLAFLLERELYEGGWEQDFDGEVIGLIPAGAFVGFGPYEGFLPARRMPGDYFRLNEEGTALVGRRTGSTLRLTDPVTVRVDRIERERGRVDLLLSSVSS